MSVPPSLPAGRPRPSRATGTSPRHARSTAAAIQPWSQPPARRATVQTRRWQVIPQESPRGWLQCPSLPAAASPRRWERWPAHVGDGPTSGSVDSDVRIVPRARGGRPGDGRPVRMSIDLAPAHAGTGRSVGMVAESRRPRARARGGIVLTDTLSASTARRVRRTDVVPHSVRPANSGNR